MDSKNIEDTKKCYPPRDESEIFPPSLGPSQNFQSLSFDLKKKIKTIKSTKNIDFTATYKGISIIYGMGRAAPEILIILANHPMCEKDLLRIPSFYPRIQKISMIENFLPLP